MADTKQSLIIADQHFRIRTDAEHGEFLELRNSFDYGKKTPQLKIEMVTNNEGDPTVFMNRDQVDNLIQKLIDIRRQWPVDKG